MSPALCFEPITQLLPSGQTKIAGWEVENLHGYYYKEYWEILTAGQNDSQEQIVSESRTNCHRVPNKLFPSPEQIVTESRTNCNHLQPETLTTTEPAKNELTLNHPLTTPQPPTKVVEEGSSMQQQMQQTPLGGAAAQGGMPEEEPPQAAEVASLGGADVATTHSPSVEDKPEVAGDEPKDPGGDNFSAAAPGAENEKLSVVAAAPPLSEPQANSLLHLDMGSAIRLDFEGHQRHGRYGKIVAVDFEVGEAEVEFRIDQLVMTFPNYQKSGAESTS